jgi:hypothetical protein
MVNGILPIPFHVLATYHPQFALAVLEGVPVRPNLRTLQVTFESLTVGEQEPASFDQQISRYSIFAGVSVTIDPTNAFIGSSLKTMSDKFQADVSGVTLNMAIRSNGDDYAPVIDDIPLQMLAPTLNPAAGTWKFDNPDNPKATFTLQTPPNDAPFTVWVNFNLLVLGNVAGSFDYLCMDRRVAQEKLVAHPMFKALCGGCGSHAT